MATVDKEIKSFLAQVSEFLMTCLRGCVNAQEKEELNKALSVIFSMHSDPRTNIKRDKELSANLFSRRSADEKQLWNKVINVLSRIKEFYANESDFGTQFRVLESIMAWSRAHTDYVFKVFANCKTLAGFAWDRNQIVK